MVFSSTLVLDAPDPADPVAKPTAATALAFMNSLRVIAMDFSSCMICDYLTKSTWHPQCRTVGIKK
jgi:hypothetical protein